MEILEFIAGAIGEISRYIYLIFTSILKYASYVYIVYLITEAWKYKK